MSVIQKTRDVLSVESLLKTLAAVIFGVGAWKFIQHVSVFEIRGVLTPFAVIAGVLTMSLVIIDTDELESNVVDSMRSNVEHCFILLCYLIFLNFITMTSTLVHASAYVTVSLFVFFSFSALSDILDAAV